MDRSGLNVECETSSRPPKQAFPYHDRSKRLHGNSPVFSRQRVFPAIAGFDPESFYWCHFLLFIKAHTFTRHLGLLDHITDVKGGESCRKQ